MCVSWVWRLVWEGRKAYRCSLSPASVTPSLILSVVDLELSGVILSEISVVAVSHVLWRKLNQD